jgi:hypothetical protein
MRAYFVNIRRKSISCVSTTTWRCLQRQQAGGNAQTIMMVKRGNGVVKNNTGAVVCSFKFGKKACERNACFLALAEDF